ncbi:hypothetical protein LCGC14_1122550 [marine sediment metagenome]|uniref:Uncharacterized protein n=1 Tax=marine sediment metagenome TaxID=412755 RepID=A0A0F9PLQ5_9ZZZZ
MTEAQKKERAHQIALGTLDYNNRGDLYLLSVGQPLMVWDSPKCTVSTVFVPGGIIPLSGIEASPECKYTDIVMEAMKKNTNDDAFKTTADMDKWVRDKVAEEIEKGNMEGSYETAIFGGDEDVIIIENYGYDKQAAISGHKWYVDLMVFNRPDKITEKVLRRLRCTPKERQ